MQQRSGKDRIGDQERADTVCCQRHAASQERAEPANRAQLLGGGMGVMADDIVAGIYACLASHLALWGIAQLHHRA